MYLEERIINGWLHVRSTPDGEWRLANSPVALVVNSIVELSEEKRLEVMRMFCNGCGRVQPAGSRCYCQDDE